MSYPYTTTDLNEEGGNCDCDDRLNKIDIEIAALMLDVGALEVKMKQVLKDVESMKSRIDILDFSMSKILNDVFMINAQIQEIQTKYDYLSEEVSKLDDDSNITKENVNKLTRDIDELKLITDILGFEIDEIKNKKMDSKHGYLIDDTLQHVNAFRYRSVRHNNHEFDLYHDSADMFITDYMTELIMPDFVSTQDGKYNLIPVFGCHGNKYMEFINNVRFSKIPNMILYSSCIINNLIITKVEVPFNIKILPFRCFFGCINFESVTISGVEAIAMQCFAHCIKLKYLLLPNFLGSIEEDAFYGCNFETLVILSNRKVLEASLQIDPFKREVKFKYIYAYPNIIDVLKI
jgi:hypothetical protein